MSKKSATGSKQQARQRLRAERERQAAIAKKRDRIVKGSIVAIVVLAIAGIGGLVYWQTTSESEPGSPPSDVAHGVQASDAGPGMGNGIGVGDPDAAVVMEIYEDFMCPACQAFEVQAGPTIDDLVESGDARLVRYPMSSGAFGEPSRAAANAYACAVDDGIGDEFHKATFARGLEESVQWNDDQLVAIGAELGADSAQFEQCVQDREYEDWTDSINDNAQDRGVTGTPTLYIEGEEVAFTEGDVPAEIITQRVQQAQEGESDEGSGDAGGADDAD